MSIMNLTEIGIKNLIVGGSDGQLLSSDAMVTNTQAPEENTVPTEFALNQNYPNPFNPSTLIKFSVPQTSPVRITVYNMLGQQVRTLFSGVMEAGTQTLTFDGKDQSGRTLSSGTYIYRMSAGTFVETKKMMLMK
jgi:flagellar hook assembly protein FlgD